MDAASDAEVLAATSQLEALEVSILELEEKKKEVLAFLARKMAAVLVSAGSEAAEAMDVDAGAAAASDEAQADDVPFAAAAPDDAASTGAGPPSRTTFDKLKRAVLGRRVGSCQPPGSRRFRLPSLPQSAPSSSARSVDCVCWPQTTQRARSPCVSRRRARSRRPRGGPWSPRRRRRRPSTRPSP
mmetsp:Transcript_1239/g.3843  ORF Transcript_1239/g.3843 Transcript_1239/m.3843 type:complete len:185 (-) Transcript_1239:23-577(-)